MGSAFHQLCPRYSGTLTPTAPRAIRLWDTFTFNILDDKQNIAFTNNYIFTREPNAGMVYDCENCEDSSLTAQTLTH